MAALIGPTAGCAQVGDEFPKARVNTSNLALPFAEEVFVDVPSARHASRYQRGAINGLRYVLYPDGSGKVRQASGQRKVLHRLECRQDKSCEVISHDGKREVVHLAGQGAPDPVLATDAASLAMYLAKWVLAANAVTSEHPTEEPVQAVEQAESAKIAVSKRPVSRSLKPRTPKAFDMPVALAAMPVPKTARALARPLRISTQSRKADAFDRSVTGRLPRAKKPKTRKRRTPKHQTFFQRIKLNCAISGSVTLRYKNSKGAQNLAKPRASLGCGAKLSDKFSLRVSVIGQFDSAQKQSYDAEFTYAFTYRATEDVTFTYSNYSGQFGSSGKAFMESLASGKLRVNYRLPKFTLPNQKTIGCSAGIGLAKPEDSRANFSCSYAMTDKFRIYGSAYAYFSGNQRDWDSDFSYGASYRISKDWSVSYSNYANNRFFWNKSNSSSSGILGGALSVTYRFEF